MHAHTPFTHTTSRSQRTQAVSQVLTHTSAGPEPGPHGPSLGTCPTPPASPPAAHPRGEAGPRRPEPTSRPAPRPRRAHTWAPGATPAPWPHLPAARGEGPGALADWSGHPSPRSRASAAAAAPRRAPSRLRPPRRPLGCQLQPPRGEAGGSAARARPGRRGGGKGPPLPAAPAHRGGLCIVLLPAWLRGLGSPRPAWSPRPPSADARAGQGGAGGRGAGRMESGRQGVGGTSPLGAGQRAPVRAGAPPALGDLGQEGQRLGAPASSTERQARGKLKAPWGPWRELSPRCVSCPHSQGSVQSRGQRALRGAGFGFPGPVLQGTKASLRDPVHTCVRPCSQEACSARAARTPAPGASGSAGSRLRL